MSSDVFADPITTPEQTVDEEILAAYRRQAGLAREQLIDAAVRRIRYELDLPAGDRQRAVLERLRAWLAIGREEASYLARGFDSAADLLSSQERDDLRDAQRDAVYNGLTFHEFEQLTRLLPEMGGWQASFSSFPERVASPYAFIAAAMCAGSV